MPPIYIKRGHNIQLGAALVNPHNVYERTSDPGTEAESAHSPFDMVFWTFYPLLEYVRIRTSCQFMLRFTIQIRHAQEYVNDIQTI